MFSTGRQKKIASVLEEVQDFVVAPFSAACHLPLFLEEIVMLSAFIQTLSRTDLRFVTAKLHLEPPTRGVL